LNNRLQTLLNRLPSHFSKDEDSNNYKLLSIIAENSNENRVVYDTVLKYWDVDQAEGIGLDRLGKDEGISRGGMNDEEYRKMIKIQCIVNMSDGDIPTMNLILDAYMEQGFIGLQDGWAEFEPASLLLNISSSATTIPEELIKRIKPAGVRVYVLLNEIVEKIWLLGGTYGWNFNGRICGRFKTASVHAAIGKERLGIRDEPYTFLVSGPTCGRFRAGRSRT